MWEDRKKQEPKEAAITVPRCHTRNLTTILQEPRKDEGRLKEEDPLDRNCKFSRLNPRRKHGMTGGSWRRGCGRNLLMGFLHRSPLPSAPVFSCLHTYLSHPFFLDIMEKTYNLEPPISIYLKNTSLYLHALSVLS